MLQWILIGVIVFLVLCVLGQRRIIGNISKYNDEIFEEKWQERDEHNQELDERQKSHEEEFTSTLKEIARSCFREFFYLYYNDLDLDKSKATNNAVKKRFRFSCFNIKCIFQMKNCWNIYVRNTPTSSKA